ncbi:hypothetical protein [Ferruginibacter albus]|uniref:hypothetical protein n=1 Tax=Ferruginibacter albus TaxID=2875540 RepID=UPI001CC4AD55|nr:hypothetical protein [Ferruginibacter albus]UAY51518.1 hypothetical protein K9M53_13090 [Ferruginibacter albus]
MIEVFKTNITCKETAAAIVIQLQSKLPHAKINFDLHDCDNILRVDAPHDMVQLVTAHLADAGFYCEVLQ